MVLRERLKRRLPRYVIQALRDVRTCLSGPPPLQHRLLAMLGLPIGRVDDSTWLELQFRPQETLQCYGIPLPSFPPDHVQRRFTGREGRDNLQQAFSFYQYVCSTCNVARLNEPKILDFGGGWGRVSRFFLRETKPELIWIADCLSDSIYWLQATQNPCNVIKNEPLPPISGLDTQFDLIFAFSVFSHLSEHYLQVWLSYLLGCIRLGGYLVFTTRGHHFMDHLERIHSAHCSSCLSKKLPHPHELRTRYMKGEFQFYPMEGGGELTSDFFGETLIPRSYFEINYGSSLVDFTEEVPDVDQSIIVLQKRPG